MRFPSFYFLSEFCGWHGSFAILEPNFQSHALEELGSRPHFLGVTSPSAKTFGAVARSLVVKALLFMSPHSVQ